MKWIRNSAVVLLVAVFVVSLLLNVRHYTGRDGQSVVSDTTRITVIDTITYLKPVPRDSVVIRYITEKLPVAKPEGNIGVENIPENGNIAEKNIQDSVEVEIPITQKVYDNDMYRAYVSGFRANLDSLIFYPQKEVITINNTYPKPKQKRWGISIQAGYGVAIGRTPQFAPCISIGISYNLINF